MNALTRQAEPAVTKLLDAEDDQLYEQLGIRARALAIDPGTAGSFDPSVTYDEARMGLKDDVKEFGKRLFRRWNKEAHNLVCGSKEGDQKDREDLLKAFGVSESVVAATVAALLVSSLGVAPAIAAVVAALAVRKFFRPGYEEFCAVWGEHLAEGGA